jgi:hypothetical protein
MRPTRPSTKRAPLRVSQRPTAWSQRVLLRHAVHAYVTYPVGGFDPSIQENQP